MVELKPQEIYLYTNIVKLYMFFFFFVKLWILFFDYNFYTVLNVVKSVRN